MTQDEKIQNKKIIDFWTIKTQLKSFILEKNQIIKNFVKKQKYRTFYDQIVEANQTNVNSVQLNQKQMKTALEI